MAPRVSALRAFLTAEWRHLAMINYAVDPRVLKPLMPRGTELDGFDGLHLASVVGFRFLRTRVFGLPVPLHADFEEVNLRFYVRRKINGEWRRGVTFVREIVPRRLVAWTARAAFGEPYLALPMRHVIEAGASDFRLQYAWRREGREESLSLRTTGECRETRPGSLEEFITEHYWGYTSRGQKTSEYGVEHARWRTWAAVDARLDADVTTLYGLAFAEALSAPPHSALVAEGSPVIVRMGREIPGGIV